VGFRKAFDSIHRERMVHILSAYGIPPKIVAAIVAVATPDGEIRFFEILAGVLEENMGLCLAALITNTDVDRL